MTLRSRSARAWVALVGLAGAMGLLIIVFAGTIRYWQAWVYLSIFFPAAALTTRYLITKGSRPARTPHERWACRRKAGGPEVHNVVHVGGFHYAPRSPRARPSLSLVDRPALRGCSR